MVRGPCIIGIVLVVLTLQVGVGTVWAQAEGDAAVRQSSDTVLHMIQKSGVSGISFMAALGGFSLAMGMVTIERLAHVTRTRILPRGFAAELRTIGKGGSDAVGPLQELCRRYPSAAANVLRAGLLRIGRPVVEVEKAMEDAIAREVAGLRSGVRPLSVIASVAPLVGLLGTVVGMIQAFYLASEHGLGGRANTFAEGIYLALLTTAAGLSIAIPALLFAAFFNNRIDKLTRAIAVSLMEILPSFDRKESEGKQ